MDITLLTEDKDPMGSAVYDYFKQGKAARLRVFSSQFEEDEIPVKDLFRSYEEMPLLEQKALQLAEGKFWMWEREAVAIRWLSGRWARRHWRLTFRPGR